MKRVALAAMVLLAGVTGACSGDPPVAQQVAAVPLDLPAPSYVLVVEDGLLVRSGDAEVLLPQARSGTFLGNGDVLVNTDLRRTTFAVLDPSTGRLEGRVRPEYPDAPGRSVTRINLLDQYSEPAVLRSHDLALDLLATTTLPGTDDQEALEAGATRGYYGVAATIGDRTFVLWGDGSETYEDGDRGVARILHDGDGGGTVDDILVNERVVSLHLSSDGASLLAVRQSSGDPCGGCDVDQDIAEIDPEAGTLTDYGRPGGYTSAWRVDALDRVGDRVAVRYVETVGPRQDRVRLVGTYVYEDGDWSLLPGSQEAVTWWQSGGRVIGRPLPGNTGDEYRFSWVRDGSSVEQPIRGRLADQRRGSFLTGSIPGQLLSPTA